MEAMERAEEKMSGLQEKMLLLAHGAPVRGREWMQMGMFMISRIYGDMAREAGYEAGPAGPHSGAVEGCVERLAGAGMLEEGAGGMALTDSGVGAAEGLRSAADKRLIRNVECMKGFVNSLSADELLCYVVMAHPDLATGTPRRAEVAERAEVILTGMVWEGKISIGRVAELIDKSIEYVRKKLRGQGYLIPL